METTNNPNSTNTDPQLHTTLLRPMRDIEIVLATPRSNSVWASSLHVRTYRPIRLAGRVDEDATEHTLLATGLLATLESITYAQLKRLEKHPPELLVKSSNLNFLEWLNGSAHDVHIVGDVKVPLLKSLRRFRIVTLPVELKTFGLGHWSYLTSRLVTPKYGQRAELVPQIVSIAT